MSNHFLYLLFFLFISLSSFAQSDPRIKFSIDSSSVKPGYTAWRFNLKLTNGSDKAVSVLKPEWYLVDARWTRPSNTALGIVSSPYVLTIKSESDCKDSSFVARVDNPYFKIPEQVVITVLPGETKILGEIYINDHESCYKRDRAHGLFVSVHYRPVINKNVLSQATEQKIKSISDRLWNVYIQMNKLKMNDAWHLQNMLRTEIPLYLNYEKNVLTRITDLNLQSNTVFISQ